MARLTLFSGAPARPEPGPSAPECPACGGPARHLGRRGQIDIFECTDASCALRYNVHDPGVVTPRAREEPDLAGSGPR
jgi:hypothetical protein